MKIPKRHTKVGMFLVQSGVLDSGDEAAIADKIREYYRTYDRNKKQQKRNVEKRSCTLSFPPHQIKAVKQRAQQYGLGIIDYLKLLTKADIARTSCQEQTVTFKEILQVLQYYKNVIKEYESKEANRFRAKNDFEAVHRIVRDIEGQIRTILNYHDS